MEETEKEPFLMTWPHTKPTYYYGIAKLSASGPDKPPLVYTDLKSALQAASRNPGSKIKIFHDEVSAIQFSFMNNTYEEVDSSVAKSELTGDRLPFKGPSKRQILQFRKTIENGDLESFLKYIWSNPRFLIAEGDTAVILQEGCRYNALHIAVKYGQPYFCEYILQTITSKKYVGLLYPNDNDITLQNRIFYLTDQYLNTPDKVQYETPLHFATKFGFVDCARVLLSYHLCDKSRVNKGGKAPLDVIGSRRSLSPESKNQLELLFESTYVPLLRSPDNTLPPKIEPPCNESPLTSPFLGDKSGEMQVKAYAGPMSPAQAKDFFHQWKRLPRPSPIPDINRLRELRYTDPEKGLEAYGRRLSEDFKVGWSEHWPFLNAWCNLKTREGLTKLEAHIIETKIKLALKDKMFKEKLPYDDLLKNVGDSPYPLSLKERTFWELNSSKITSLFADLNLPGISTCTLKLTERDLNNFQVFSHVLNLIHSLYISVPYFLMCQKPCMQKNASQLAESIGDYFQKVENAIDEHFKEKGFLLFKLDKFHEDIAQLVASCYQINHQKHALKLGELLHDFLPEVEKMMGSSSQIFTPVKGKTSEPTKRPLGALPSTSDSVDSEMLSPDPKKFCMSPYPPETILSPPLFRPNIFSTAIQRIPTFTRCTFVADHFYCILYLVEPHLSNTEPDECTCSCDLFNNYKNLVFSSSHCTLKEGLSSILNIKDAFNYPSQSVDLNSSEEEEEDEVFQTPPGSPPPTLMKDELPSHCFLTGEVPSKLDMDVFYAVDKDIIKTKQFPHVYQWYKDVSKLKDTKGLISPASSRFYGRIPLHVIQQSHAVSGETSRARSLHRRRLF